ncbi:MAG TPA: phage holin family protein [Gemmatimonadaceae bacterium]|nr:phage holin family protein [Gemmatimonadaceae bacterium]
MQMDTRISPDGRQSLGALLGDLAQGGARLVRQEARLARLEAADAVRWVGKGTIEVALGGVLLFLGALALLVGVILLAGDQWLRDRYWLAALLVTLVVGGVAAWMAMRGRRLLAPERLLPDETMETLEEDREWLKRQLTSGATSR